MTPNAFLWELERYDWESFFPASMFTDLPELFKQLASAQTKEAALVATRKIEYLTAEGGVYSASPAAMRCLCLLLCCCSDIVREYVLDLIYSIGRAADDASEQPPPEEQHTLANICGQEMLFGCRSFYYYLQFGTASERITCLRLVYLCARYDPYLRKQTLWYLERYMEQFRNGLEESRYIALVRNIRDEIVAMLPSETSLQRVLEEPDR